MGPSVEMDFIWIARILGHKSSPVWGGKHQPRAGRFRLYQQAARASPTRLPFGTEMLSLTGDDWRYKADSVRLAVGMILGLPNFGAGVLKGHHAWVTLAEAGVDGL